MLRALIVVADAELGAAQTRPFREPLAQLQLLYAHEAEADATREEQTETSAPGAEGEQESGLWTPGADAPGDGSRIWTPTD